MPSTHGTNSNVHFLSCIFLSFHFNPPGEPSEPDPTRVGNPYAKFVPKKKASSDLGFSDLRDRIAAQDQELRQLRQTVKGHEDENRLLVTKLTRFRETVSRQEKRVNPASINTGSIRGVSSLKVRFGTTPRGELLFS